MQNLGINTHGMKAKRFRLVGRGLAGVGRGRMGEGEGVMNISQVQYATYVYKCHFGTIEIPMKLKISKEKLLT